MRPILYQGLPGFVPRRVPTQVRRPQPKRCPHLRPHEEWLVRLLSQGLTLKEAAGEIGVTAGTGKQYIDHARKRMGMRTTAQLVASWVEHRHAPEGFIEGLA